MSHAADHRLKRPAYKGLEYFLAGVFGNVAHERPTTHKDGRYKRISSRSKRRNDYN